MPLLKSDRHASSDVVIRTCGASIDVAGVPVQALPPQPNSRPKRERSAESFVSPLDRAAHSDDSSSALSHTNDASNSASGFNFYQVCILLNSKLIDSAVRCVRQLCSAKSTWFLFSLHFADYDAQRSQQLEHCCSA